MYAVYRLLNLINGKLYVGKTKDVDERWAKHRYYAKKVGHPCRSLVHKAIAKYGPENFQVDVLERCLDEETAFRQEAVWIETLKSNDLSRGYNLNEGGQGGRNPSSEVRAKIGKSRQGAKHPMFGRTGPLNPCHGKPFTEQHKANIRLAKKGAHVGEKNPRAKLTAEDVKEIREQHHAERCSRKELAAQYQVSKSTIDAILSNRLWKDVK